MLAKSIIFMVKERSNEMKLKCTTLIIVLVLANPLYAWDNVKTHPAITTEATNSNAAQIDNYLKSQMGMADGLSTPLYWNFPSDIKVRINEGKASPSKTTRSVLEWIQVGSIIEDQDDHTITPPWRPRHHFHAPVANTGVEPANPNAGLDNHEDHPNWDAPLWSSWLPLGQSAMDWAITGTAVQEPTTNNDTWAAARSMFYDSLRSATKNDREAQLAEAFLKLGCVFHMLEDMGVPAHTRNDFLFGHFRSAWFDWGNPFETWVEEQIEDNGEQSLWAGASPVVFDSLTEYFDADVYAGGYLGDGVLPPGTWGLSECTNYQFLSLSTVFGCTGTLYQFPHPAIGNTTLLFESVPDGSKVYFDGSNYGVTHLARDSYTRYKGFFSYVLSGLSIDNTITTDDTGVFSDYADITIPRTIDYTAGLANYFFRGSIDVSIGCPQGCDPATSTATYSMVITNTSMNTDREQVLKGGAFEFYWDDPSGNRTQATDLTVYTYDEYDPDTTLPWDQDSVLPYDKQIKAEVTFDVLSCTDITDYVVVYKGAINDSQYPDETDAKDTEALACWTKSASFSVPATSYTLLVTDWGGTDEYYECAEYLQHIFDTENPDGYTLAKTPDSSCFDCRWRRMDYHTCASGSPYCPGSCNVTQIMTLSSSTPDEICILISPFQIAYCGFGSGPLCNGLYKRCFSKDPGESYDEFRERVFNGGVFGDGSEADCTEEGCMIPAFFAWTDGWVRVLWMLNP